MYQLYQYKMALSSKKTHKAKTKVLTKTEHNSSVTSIDQVKSSFYRCQHLGYQPLTNQHATLSADFVSNSVPYCDFVSNSVPYSAFILAQIHQITSYIATKLSIRHSEAPKEALTTINTFWKTRKLTRNPKLLYAIILHSHRWFDTLSIHYLLMKGAMHKYRM